ncbi:MAG: hypothetical protein M3448_02215 [Pseudomonadota bacterium]|nr:hypothetical protein [Pseudomonadota bacterium]
MAIYRYIITADTGMAPAVADGLISLATCKPVVRRSTRVGDWVVACRASPAPPGLVAWAGRVRQKLEIADYEREFRGRPDAVYRLGADGDYVRLRPDYHNTPEQVATDLSGPALVFDPEASWYFGSSPKLLPDDLLHLAPRGQGHRVNGAGPDDEQALLVWLRNISPPGVQGSPPDAPDGECGGCIATKPRAPPGC